MTDSKTRATAVVTMTVSVNLDQPWLGDATLEQVQKQAKDDALALLSRSLTGSGVRVGEIRSIRIVLNEEKL